MQAVAALLLSAGSCSAAHPPDQCVQVAGALRSVQVYFFRSAPGGNPTEKCLLNCMVVAGILHNRDISFISTKTLGAYLNYLAKFIDMEVFSQIYR
jgi:hypothetical protein